MKLGIRELGYLLVCVDGYRQGLEAKGIDRPLEKLGIKLSKELNKRGFTNLVSKAYLKLGGFKNEERIQEID